MTVPQVRILVEDNVHLHIQLVAGVVGLEILDLRYSSGETHGQVEEDVAFVGGGCGTGEIADMSCTGSGPICDDEEGEKETSKCIEPPYLGVVPDCVVDQQDPSERLPLRGGECYQLEILY